MDTTSRNDVSVEGSTDKKSQEEGSSHKKVKASSNKISSTKQSSGDELKIKISSTKKQVKISDELKTSNDIKVDELKEPSNQLDYVFIINRR